jgi:hypothetical protein
MESSADRIFLSPASSSLGSQALAYSLIPSHPLRRRKAVTSLVKKSTCMVSAINPGCRELSGSFFLQQRQARLAPSVQETPGLLLARG